MAELHALSFEQTERDLALLQHVRHMLYVLQVPSVRRLNVDVEQGTVVLRGRLRNYYLRQMALAAVRRIPGVEDVVDEITVGESAPAEPAIICDGLGRFPLHLADEMPALAG